MNRIERNYYLTLLIEKRDNGRVKVITGTFDICPYLFSKIKIFGVKTSKSSE